MRAILASLMMLCAFAMLSHVGLMLADLARSMARFGGIPWSADFIRLNWPWALEAAAGLALSASGLGILFLGKGPSGAAFPAPPSASKGAGAAEQEAQGS